MGCLECFVLDVGDVAVAQNGKHRIIPLNTKSFKRENLNFPGAGSGLVLWVEDFFFSIFSVGFIFMECI